MLDDFAVEYDELYLFKNPNDLLHKPCGQLKSIILRYRAVAPMGQSVGAGYSIWNSHIRETIFP